MNKNNKILFPLAVVLTILFCIFCSCVVEAPKEELVPPSIPKSKETKKNIENAIYLNFDGINFTSSTDNSLWQTIISEIKYEDLRMTITFDESSGLIIIDASGIEKDVALVLKGQLDSGGVKIISSTEHEISIYLEGSLLWN